MSPGDLFVALRGAVADGHEYIDRAEPIDFVNRVELMEREFQKSSSEKRELIQSLLSESGEIEELDERVTDEMQDYAKTTNVILGTTLYSDSWLEL